MIMSEVWLCQEHTPTRSSVVHQSFTALRKLTHHREVVDGSLKRRDIIEDYNNYASQVTMSFYNVFYLLSLSIHQVYAPSMVIGVYLDYGSEQFHVKSNYTSNYYGLLQLEASLPHHILNPR